MKQNHYWREPLTEHVNVLDIGRSELIDSNVNDMKMKRSSFTVCEGSCTSLSDTRCDTESLHTAGMVGLGPNNQECNSSDVSGVARKILPSEGGRDVTAHPLSEG